MRLFDVVPYQTGTLVAEREGVDDTTLAAISERILEARCLERGLPVSRPSADAHGVDLLVAGLRTQVKSTRSVWRTRGYDYYRFRAGNGDVGRFDERSLRCDVFAFYAHDCGRLWLLRSEEVRARWRGGRAVIRPGEQRWLDDFTVFGVGGPTPSGAPLTPAGSAVARNSPGRT